jgi:hypothetical protein
MAAIYSLSPTRSEGAGFIFRDVWCFRDHFPFELSQTHMTYKENRPL